MNLGRLAERLILSAISSRLVDAIHVRGARVHNLQNVDVDIPHEKLVVITGVSGSGKSSLAFDTLFAEGRRRYLESLSTYSRQFLNQLERPDIDILEGLPPTLSIEQRVGTPQPRSTLGTTTEIYDYLRLLYARAGQAHCYRCNREVSQQSPQAIVDAVLGLGERTKVMLLAPLVQGRKGAHRKVFEQICREGFVRARVDGELIDATEPPELKKTRQHDIDVVIDRIVVKGGVAARVAESVELALKHGEGTCVVHFEQSGHWQDRRYSTRFACVNCGISFDELQPRTFSFNSPYGACTECGGMGQLPLDPDNDGDEPPTQKPCEACGGSRLGPVARAVTVSETSIQELTSWPISRAYRFITDLQEALTTNPLETFPSSAAQLAAGGLLIDLETRLRFLLKVGLDYLSLDRSANTLSGGEFQRARLAACLGGGLTGVCYILDEPTIGLHRRDVSRLIDVLEELRDQGNSVLVVEHDPAVMERADYLIDVGPGAGERGGCIVGVGTPQELSKTETLTGQFLFQDATEQVLRKPRRADPKAGLLLREVTLHNLKNVSLELPLGVMTCVTGVSGSGKSSLIVDSLIPAVRQTLNARREAPDEPGNVSGLDSIDRMVLIDQSGIGKSGRSNPATYSGLWDEVRKVFARTREARIRGYKPARFSFNGKQGRCEHCRGQGTTRIEMNFLPDMYVTCPDCRGARFNPQTLEVRFLDKTVADVLAMPISTAAQFFENVPKLQRALATFVDVGLGYLVLGQSALTLSGGEAQRVKLATELIMPQSGRAIYILDEPTTGLHPADVRQLLVVLDRLVEAGHTVVVIEHDAEVILAADWIIDMGPEGGESGGRIVATGTPEQILQSPESVTGRSLRKETD